MTRNALASAVLVALLGTVALAGCKKKEPVEPAAPVATTPAPASLPPAQAPAAATVSVTTVDLGNAIGPDMKVITPATTFAPKDTIYAAIGTNTSDPAAAVPGKLGVKWTHVDSNQVVHEDTRDLTLTGTGTTEFHIAKPDGWPTGKYKVEISQDGNVVQTREFEIR
jgi:hypothetical protein